jgi:glutathione S-transferase
MRNRPLLWHIPISHYNEKVRWALDYKGIPHGRRAALGGTNMLVPFMLTRGRSITLPLLQLGGEVFSDSTTIIAELEARWPDPPLYPSDPPQRTRALELEDYFDENLGAPIRHFAYHQLMSDPAAFESVARGLMPLGPLAGVEPVSKASTAMTRSIIRTRFGIGAQDSADRAEAEVRSALDHLEAELDGNDYLVGDRFTVADLTAASLFYPIVQPPGSPQGAEPSEGMLERRAELEDRPGFQWVQETYRRHRQGREAAVAMGSPTTS